MLHLNESREDFCWRGRAKWTKNRKDVGTNNRESGARNLEADGIKSSAESTGRCVKWKTVTEIRRSNARDTFIAFIYSNIFKQLFKYIQTVPSLSHHVCSFLSVSRYLNNLLLLNHINNILINACDIALFRY